MSTLVKQSFEKLIAEVQKNPNKARASFETTSVLKDRVSVTSTARQFTFHADEAEVTGGEDSAPNPLEYLVASLGACQAITYKALASLKGIQLDHVEVKIKGFTDLNGFLGLDKKIRPGYLKVEVETIIESEEDPQLLKELSRHVEALCPVLDIFSKANEVKGNLTVRKVAGLVA